MLYFQLERLLLLKNILDELRGDSILGNFLLSVDEWKLVSAICSILEPFNRYTKLLQSATCTLSDFYGYYTALNLKLEKNDHEFALLLLAELQKFQSTLMENPLLVSAVYMDPRFQRGLSKDMRDLAVHTLITIHSKMEKMNNKSTIVTDSLDSGKDSSLEELDSYLNSCEGHVEENRTPPESTIKSDLENFFGTRMPLSENVLQYWSMRNDTLSPLAQAILSSSPTQTAVERAFFALRILLTCRRTCLADKILQETLIIRLNPALYYQAKAIN